MARHAISASLCTLLLIAAPAMADEVTIAAPIQAGSLHERDEDMVAYYLPVGSKQCSS